MITIIKTLHNTALLCAAALAFVGLSTVPAQAAADKTEKAPYQQAVTSTCYETQYCVINFPATTAQTVIHNVACWGVIGTGAVVQQLSFYFTNPSTGATNVGLTINSAGPNGEGLTSWSNLPTLLFMDSGVVPNIFLQLDSGTLSYLTCTISGWTLG